VKRLLPRGSLKGLRPFKNNPPLSFKGEGDTGGEVGNMMNEYAIVLYVTEAQDVGRN